MDHRGRGASAGRERQQAARRTRSQRLHRPLHQLRHRQVGPEARRRRDRGGDRQGAEIVARSARVDRGHTDNVGQPAPNKALSEKRAQSVMAAVIAGGIDAKRLSAAGFGQERPVADNRTEEGRAKNRRVELVKK
ncbi:MAG: OmpA family protein [Acidobacteria bacterium]|nr:OmpA family protein [Acidobacteriota bacterium]